MTLVVSGTAADSWVTLAEFSIYANSNGKQLKTADENEATLRRAAMYLSVSYQFAGVKDDSSQRLAFPRDGATPQVIKDAQCELALMILSGVELFGADHGDIKRERNKVDVLETEIEYRTGKSNRPALSFIDALLAPFLISTPAHGQGVFAARRG